MTNKTYSVTLHPQNHGRFERYENIVSDGFVPNTEVRFLVDSKGVRTEFHSSAYLAVFSSERQRIIEEYQRNQQNG